jgi:purine-binding chemotaxis protein CheW
MNRKNQVVSFIIGREVFGVSIDSVQEIVRVPEITAVPEMPSFVEGVINLRGKIVSIIDLSKRFRVDGTSRSKSSRILIVEVEKKVIGLLVDAVTEILRLPPESIEPAPDIVTAVGAEYILGVGKLPEKLLILLDLKHVLKAEDIRKIVSNDRQEGTDQNAPSVLAA